MQTDWKDALAALNASGSIPQDNTADSDRTGAADSAATESLDRNRKSGSKLHIEYSTKGRKGKPATIIYGFEEDDEVVEEVAARLKKMLGSGGSARCGEILLQGDRREKAAQLLREMGYKVS